jgi:hypothetical protein
VPSQNGEFTVRARYDNLIRVDRNQHSLGRDEFEFECACHAAFLEPF